MSDFLKSVPQGFDLERKLLCNFDGALRYICEEWPQEMREAGVELCEPEMEFAEERKE